jgi:murein DD-endopeptidase MepM/ murein hydrolase activator NlpD
MLTRATSRKSNSRKIAAALTAACACALAISLPAAASAQTAGGSSYGGTQFYTQPVITALQCQTLCTASARVSQSGSVSVKEKGVLRIRGRDFTDVAQVLFVGSSSYGDNVTAKPITVGHSFIDVKVPVQAASGKVILLDPAGKGSKASAARLKILRDASALSAQGLIWPVTGMITGVFGENRGDHMHTGLDIATSTGTNIKAAADGRVILQGPQGGYGNFVCLQHAVLVTCYAHLSAYATRYDQFVRQGQSVGRVGCTGNCSGPHLHFEVRKGPGAWSTPMDPVAYLPRR